MSILLRNLLPEVIYRFKGSNGARHITFGAEIPDEIDVSSLLNPLREEIKTKDKELAENKKQIAQLEKDLEKERNKRTSSSRKTVTKSKKTLESVSYLPRRKNYHRIFSAT